ncbi:MAG TPA: hypothetical protein VES42_24815 [Pilimelia sp.]|nr:hypothetical protein [Pilimelia sp.]
MNGCGRPGVRRLGIVALLAASLVMGVGACRESEETDRSVAIPDEKHPYSVFLGEELGLVDYAFLKVRNRCLADNGFPQNLRIMLDRPGNPFAHFIVSARTLGPTSETEARRIGFGYDQPAKPAAVVSFDPNYDKALERCSERAWGRLGEDAEQVYESYFDLGNKLGEPLWGMIDDRMDRAMPGKLMACLTGKGYRIPQREKFLRRPNPREIGVRIGMPDGGPAARWVPPRIPGTVQVGPPGTARRYQAPPAEGALAVAWLQCRESTGFTAHQLAVAAEVQRELVGKYEDVLAELNPRVQRVAREATALIGSA